MRKERWIVVCLVTVAMMLLAVTACAQPTGQQTGGSTEATKTPAGNPVLNSEQLSEIAPGLGTVMVETGYRNWVLNYAGQAGNWGLAWYQAKEIGEILEVGETTRPKRKAMLEEFRSTSLQPVMDAINAGDKAAFTEAYKNEVEACNGCHNQTDFSYIQWKVPTDPPPDLKMDIPSTSPSSTAATGSTGTSPTTTSP